MNSENVGPEKEDLSKFPSAFQMARNAFKQSWETAKGAARGKPIFASPEKASGRLKVCESCEFYKENRCIKCGCFMHAKVHVEMASCPEKKWTIELQSSITPPSCSKCNKSQNPDLKIVRVTGSASID